jgi:anoctamin-7
VIAKYKKTIPLSRFLGSDNHITYFNPTQRHQAAYEILQTTVYGKKKRAEIGIDRLIEEDVFTAAYPMHEVSLLFPNVSLPPPPHPHSRFLEERGTF